MLHCGTSLSRIGSIHAQHDTMKQLIITLMLSWPWLAYGQAQTSNQAFRLHLHPQGQAIVAEWQIAQGYHLYEDAIHVEDASHNRLPIKRPSTQLQLHHRAIYQHHLRIIIPKPPTGSLYIHYQGCEGLTLCYPPMTQSFVITQHHGKLGIARASHHQAHWLLLLSSFGIGILLALTPCVWPMMPIVATLIMGEERQHLKRVLALTLTYVIAMAISYALAGLAAAWLGYSLQSQLQNLWFSTGFALLCLLMAGQLLNWYELAWTTHLQRWGHRVQTRTPYAYLRAALLGFTTILVVAPCVSAPMVGLLTLISTQQQPWLGGMALFLTGLGMGLPFLLINTLGQRFLPKQGPWMLWVKELLGLSLLALAIWLLRSHLSSAWIGTLAFCLIAVWLGHHMRSMPSASIRRGLLLALLGITLIASLTLHRALTPPKAQPNVTSLARLQQILRQHSHQAMILDFTASWCVACELVHDELLHLHQLKPAIVIVPIDISQANAQTRLLQQTYHVFAPPALLILDPSHRLSKRFDGRPDETDLLISTNKIK